MIEDCLASLQACAMPDGAATTTSTEGSQHYVARFTNVTVAHML